MMVSHDQSEQEAETLLASSQSDLRKWTLFGFVAVAVVVVAISLSRAGRLNAQYKADYAGYLHAAKLGPANPESGRILADLVKRSPDSFILNWNYGLFLGQNKQPQEASKYYSKALEANPFLSINGNFLFEYALILHQSGDYAKAKEYLNLALQRNLEKRFQDQAKALIQDLTRRGY